MKNVILFTAIGLLIFIINIDYTAVNIALIPIGKTFSTDIRLLQWVLSAYVLAWAVFVMPSGRFADVYGKKPVLLLGIFIFLLGSILAGLSSSIVLLIIGRAAQGLGSALFAPTCYAIIFDFTTSHRQGLVLGAIAAAGGIGLAAGPTIGGFIVKNLSWHWIFYINIPLSLLVILVIFIIVPNEKNSNNNKEINFITVFILIIIITISIFFLNQIEIWGIKDYRLYITGGIEVVLIIIFFARNLAESFPILPHSLFLSKGLLWTITSMFFIAFNFSMILLLEGLYLQSVHRYSSYDSGLIFLSMTLTVGFLSPLGGKITDLLGVRSSLIMGASFAGVSMFLMTFFEHQTSLNYIIACLLLAGIGYGLSYPAINTALFQTAPNAEINSASSLFMMASMLGNTISAIFSTNLLVIIGRHHLVKDINSHGIFLSTHQRDIVVTGISKIHDGLITLPELTPDVVSILEELINKAFLEGFFYSMIMGISFSVFTIFIARRYLGPSVSSGR